MSFQKLSREVLAIFWGAKVHYRKYCTWVWLKGKQSAVKCYACLETTPTCAISRGSYIIHIRITCKSICDRDQNGIKLSMFLFGADQGIKTNSEQLISTDQRISLDSTEAWLHFVL